MNPCEKPKYDIEDIKRVTRLVEIALAVDSRISSPKPTSKMLCDIGRGMVDKLIIKLHQSISVEDIKEKCRELGIRVKGEYKNGKKFFLCIYHPNGLVINCYLGVPENKSFYRVILNPFKVNSFSKVEHALLQVFGEAINVGVIYRLDFTVDYYRAYEEILSGLDVRYKHYQVEHMKSGKGRTGLQIGTDDDKIIIYNKGAQLGISEPLTRIERQLSGSKVFIKTFGELRSAQPKILEFDPLSIIRLHELNLIKGKILNTGQVKRFHELETLVKHEGYFQARKKLNKTKNFIRDYGEFFSLRPFEVQPSAILGDAITKYFKEVLQ